MNELAIKGRNKTIRIFASVLLLSIYIIVTYQLVTGGNDMKKLVQQIIRFSLTVLLIYFVFKGKDWARILMTMLFALGVILAIVNVFTPIPFTAKIPLFAMIIIYSLTVYHLNFSKSFREYFKHIKQKT